MGFPIDAVKSVLEVPQNCLRAVATIFTEIRKAAGINKRAGKTYQIQAKELKEQMEALIEGGGWLLVPFHKRTANGRFLLLDYVCSYIRQYGEDSFNDLLVDIKSNKGNKWEHTALKTITDMLDMFFTEAKQMNSGAQSDHDGPMAQEANICRLMKFFLAAEGQSEAELQRGLSEAQCIFSKLNKDSDARSKLGQCNTNS